MTLLLLSKSHESSGLSFRNLDEELKKKSGEKFMLPAISPFCFPTCLVIKSVVSFLELRHMTLSQCVRLYSLECQGIQFFLTSNWPMSSAKTFVGHWTLLLLLATLTKTMKWAGWRDVFTRTPCTSLIEWCFSDRISMLFCELSGRKTQWQVSRYPASNLPTVCSSFAKPGLMCWTTWPMMWTKSWKSFLAEIAGQASLRLAAFKTYLNNLLSGSSLRWEALFTTNSLHWARFCRVLCFELIWTAGWTSLARFFLETFSTAKNNLRLIPNWLSASWGSCWPKARCSLLQVLKINNLRKELWLVTLRYWSLRLCGPNAMIFLFWVLLWLPSWKCGVMATVLCITSWFLQKCAEWSGRSFSTVISARWLCIFLSRSWTPVVGATLQARMLLILCSWLVINRIVGSYFYVIMITR